MPRIVVSSDWHGDWVTDGYDRHEDLKMAIAPVIEAAMQADGFMFLGDLSNPYTRGVHRAVALGVKCARLLQEAKVPQLWVVGNHDIIEDSRRSHTLLALRSLGAGIQVADQSDLFHLAGLDIWAMPFTAPNKHYEPDVEVRQLAEKGYNVDVFAGHLHIAGITEGTESGDMARGRPMFFPTEAIRECFPHATCLNGHYHDKQTFRGIHIPGAPLRFGHGEERNNPGYLVLNL